MVDLWGPDLVKTGFGWTPGAVYLIFLIRAAKPEVAITQ
jgi:hypothetical protein